MSKRLLPALAIAALCAAVSASAGAAPEPGTVIEKRVKSMAPHHRKVRESLVRIYDPLPSDWGAPPACDWIQYLRFRSAAGPREARYADAVFVMIPGLLGGASSFDQIARHTVRRAEHRDRHVEYWALDRRANCVEDHRGLKAAARAQDATVAWDYYWGGEEVNGKKFEGFVPPEDAEYLDHFGIELTMEDWYTVLTTSMPGQPRRARKVICGGHSLGGPLTAIFSSWDFDGDAETKKDAGYKQCAGLAGLDTSFGFSGGGGGSGTGGIGSGGTAPYINAPPLTPETIQVPGVFGIGAFFDPAGTDLIKELPRTTNIDFSQRALFSKDAAHFATGQPSIRDFNIANETALAGIFDDNSSPVSILRASVGQTVGGPLTDKNFPTPDPTLALPEDPATPLYAWEGYRVVGSPGHPIQLNDEGQPYTTRESEVSDLRQLARAMFEAPADFTEQYFPTRILTDLGPAGSGGFEQMRYDGPSLRPGVLIQAGDSDANDAAADDGRPQRGEPPNDLPLSREWILPGYNHLDVATAAWRQNDGRPEPTSSTLVQFGLAAVKAARGK